MAVPYTFADTTLSGLNLNLAHLDADFAYFSGNPQINSLGVGKPADGTTGDIVASGSISDSVGTLHPIVVMPSALTTGLTEVVFSGISSWATRIIVNFYGLNVSGSANILIQFGDSSGFITNGYASTASDGTVFSSPSNGYAATVSAGLLGNNKGSITFNLCRTFPDSTTASTWTQNGILTNSDATNKLTISAGSAYFPNKVTQVKILNSTGTDTFTGVVGLTYE